MSVTATTPAKRVRVKKQPVAAESPAPAAPERKTPKAAKPTTVQHDFASDWSGDSDGVNIRVSRTAIPLDRFGTSNGALTERDRKNLEAFKQNFGNKAFERGNLDAGILRRLGERGFLAHVSGAPNEATAKFKLTSKKAA